MSNNSAPSVCPRCSGQLFEDLYGEYHCLQCGCVVYIPDEPAAVAPVDSGSAKALPASIAKK